MNRFTSCILLFLLALVTLSSCKKDEESGQLSLDQKSLYFSELGSSLTIGFTRVNLESMSTTSIPEGWSVHINFGGRTITVTAPDELSEDSDNESTGKIYFTGKTGDDSAVSASLTVGVASITDISAQQSNCYIVNQANMIYTFDATKKGETNEVLNPANVELLWQTSPSTISSVLFKDGEVRFHVAADSADLDEDGLTDDVLEGNGVIAAYDAKGNIIWSWHIWASEYDPNNDFVTLNGKTFMTRNLGAKNNSTASEDDILASYGMYYQWGRKDPFAGASTYNASTGTDAPIVNGAGSYLSFTYSASTSEIGTVEYAMAHPLTYITGVEESEYNWLYDDNSTSLWDDNKSINDPCPKGWRVPSEDAFDALTIATPYQSADDFAALKNAYGWELTDGVTSALFMGLGRRGQIAGTIQNVNTSEERPSPWVGNYWTVGAQSGNSTSSAMYFYLDTDNVANSGIEFQKQYARANGMQVRCQKE